MKGSEEPLQKRDLKDFMEGTLLPQFDLNIKWKAKSTQWNRRQLTFGQKKYLPSLRKMTVQPAGIVRQHSNSSDSTNQKRQKQNDNHDDIEDGVLDD